MNSKIISIFIFLTLFISCGDFLERMTLEEEKSQGSQANLSDNNENLGTETDTSNEKQDPELLDSGINDFDAGEADYNLGNDKINDPFMEGKKKPKDKDRDGEELDEFALIFDLDLDETELQQDAEDEDDEETAGEDEEAGINDLEEGETDYIVRELTLNYNEFKTAYGDADILIADNQAIGAILDTTTDYVYDIETWSGLVTRIKKDDMVVTEGPPHYHTSVDCSDAGYVIHGDTWDYFDLYFWYLPSTETFYRFDGASPERIHIISRYFWSCGEATREFDATAYPIYSVPQSEIGIKPGYYSLLVVSAEEYYEIEEEEEVIDEATEADEEAEVAPEEEEAEEESIEDETEAQEETQEEVLEEEIESEDDAAEEESLEIVETSDVQLDWVGTLGAESSDQIYGITFDNDDNVFYAGSFMYEVDFNIGAGEDMQLNSYENGQQNAFVSKVNSNGSYAWTRIFGNDTSFSIIYAIATDQEGNVFVTGGYSGCINFNGAEDRHCSYRKRDLFITKIFNDGSYGWTRTVKTSGQTFGFGISTGKDNDIYLTGYFYGIGDFDFSEEGQDEHRSLASDNIFIMKINSDGSYAYTKSFGSTGSDQAFSIATDSQDNLYVVGEFEKDLNILINGVEMDYEGPKSFLLKTDKAGNNLWIKTYSEESNSVHDSVKVDSEDYVIFATSKDIRKVRNDGTAVFSVLGGNIRTYSIAVDAENNIYGTGFFWNSMNFSCALCNESGTYMSKGAADIFIVKYDKAGNSQWIKTIGGDENEIAHSITVDSQQNVYAVGIFEGEVDLDPGEDELFKESNGYRDAFILKLQEE
ncbi:MAG: hypothetical protein ABIA04_15335 [Pseudomonadota bacterium]